MPRYHVSAIASVLLLEPIPTNRNCLMKGRPPRPPKRHQKTPGSKNPLRIVNEVPTICIYIYIYIYISNTIITVASKAGYIYLCTSVYIYIYIYICMCVCIYIYIYTYAYIYIYIYVFFFEKIYT